MKKIKAEVLSSAFSIFIRMVTNLSKNKQCLKEMPKLLTYFLLLIYISLAFLRTILASVAVIIPSQLTSAFLRFSAGKQIIPDAHLRISVSSIAVTLPSPETSPLPQVYGISAGISQLKYINCGYCGLLSIVYCSFAVSNHT